MNTFGVKKELILKCLSFRNDMLSYLDTRHATDFSDEFCSKVMGIYNVFGASVKGIHVEDFICFRGSSPELAFNNYMFPIYDNLRDFNSFGDNKKVVKIMKPVWSKVKDSNDLSLLLNHRHENPIFDEVLFVLIMVGAWKFGDFIKMCGDISIINDRLYEKKGDKGERMVNKYPCLPFVCKNLSLNGILVKSYIGSICSEKSVTEVLKYEGLSGYFHSLMVADNFNENKLLFDGSNENAIYDGTCSGLRLFCSPQCDFLEASYRSKDSTWFRKFLQKLSILDVVRRNNGLKASEEYDTNDDVAVDLSVISANDIFDGDLLKSMKVSLVQYGVEEKVNVK